jgi:hypothetical protein
MVFTKNTSFARPEVIKKIYELRTKGETYHHIAILIQEEFGLKITDPTIKAIYERYIGKQMVVQGSKEGKLAREIVPDYQRKMEARFDRVTHVTDDLMDTLEELKKRMPPEVYVKYIPTILMVCREILNQLNFIKKEQAQVLINQKNIIYSPLQIMNIVNTEIQKLEQEGKIEIKETTKSGRVLADSEKSHLIFSKAKTEEEIVNEVEAQEAEEA